MWAGYVSFHHALLDLVFGIYIMLARRAKKAPHRRRRLSSALTSIGVTLYWPGPAYRREFARKWRSCRRPSGLMSRAVSAWRGNDQGQAIPVAGAVMPVIVASHCGNRARWLSAALCLRPFCSCGRPSCDRPMAAWRRGGGGGRGDVARRLW